MPTALLVMDFINDIVHPEGKIATSANFIQEKNTIVHANEAIRIARQKNVLPLFVKVGFSSHYLECPANSPVFGKIKALQALQLNSWGTNFHETLEVQPQDLVVVKHRISAFYATSLEAILHANKIDTLLLSGVSTNMVVATTAREAHDRDYEVIILEDACATATAQLHENSIELLSRVAKIITVSELADLL